MSKQAIIKSLVDIIETIVMNQDELRQFDGPNYPVDRKLNTAISEIQHVIESLERDVFYHDGAGKIIQCEDCGLVPAERLETRQKEFTNAPYRIFTCTPCQKLWSLNFMR